MTISVGNLIVAGGATVDTSEVLSALNKQGLKVWVGTKTQRDALPENVKNDDKITFLTYDSEEDIYLIVDTIISYSKTWSSVKISTELAKKINSSDVYTKTEVMNLINSKVASALKYRGAVATVAALPVNPTNGDSYVVEADGLMYAWSDTSSQWDALGSITDLTDYYTKAEIDQILSDMQVKIQYSVMPLPSADFTYPIQYIGVSDDNYTSGNFYSAVEEGGSYVWKEVVGSGVKIFYGTQTEWDNLTTAQKVKYDYLATPTNSDTTKIKITNIQTGTITVTADTNYIMSLSSFGIATNGLPWMAFVWNRSSWGDFSLFGDGADTLIIKNTSSSSVTGNLQIAVLTQIGV